MPKYNRLRPIVKPSFVLEFPKTDSPLMQFHSHCLETAASRALCNAIRLGTLFRRSRSPFGEGGAKRRERFKKSLCRLAERFFQKGEALGGSSAQAENFSAGLINQNP